MAKQRQRKLNGATGPLRAKAVRSGRAGNAAARPASAHGLDNLTAQRLHANGPKLKIGAKHDRAEAEADRIAQRIARTPASPNARPRSKSNARAASSRDRVDAVTLPLGPGQPLPDAERELFESQLGADLSGVRVHEGADAARAADRIGARAFTIGNAVAFGRGEFAPHSADGRRLLAHELLHVLQQRRTAAATTHPNSSGAEPMAVRESASVGTVQRVPRDISPAEPAAAYVADAAELRARLLAMSALERLTFMQPLWSQALVNWQRAASLGLMDMIDAVPAAQRAMPDNPVQPIAGLENAGMQNLGFNIRLDTRSMRLARQLVLAETTLQAVSESADTATAAVLQLRALNDVLMRLLSAWAASQMTGTPIETTLALYRAEGNLAAPPSAASLAHGIPSGTSEALTLINPRPDFSHLVWMISPEYAAGKSEEWIKEDALSQWFVQIGGLDEIYLLRPPRREPFKEWSSRNWLAAQDIDPAAQSWFAGARTQWQASRAAAARWDQQMQNLQVRQTQSSAGTLAVIVEPQNAETLISGVLSEAVMRLRAGGKIAALLGHAPAAGMPADLDPELAYLAYNAGTDNFKRMLASAAIAASRTRGARYQALRDAIAGHLDVAALAPFMDVLGELANRLDQPDLAAEERRAARITLQAVMQAMWTPVSAWLQSDPANLPLLSEFIETAGSAVWTSWGAGPWSPRSNMSRYRVLRAFYEALAQS